MTKHHVLHPNGRIYEVPGPAKLLDPGSQGWEWMWQIPDQNRYAVVIKGKMHTYPDLNTLHAALAIHRANQEGRNGD